MRKIVFFTVIFLTLISTASNFASASEVPQTDFTCAVYFTGVGCPHCAKTDPLIFEDLLPEYPNLVVIEYEIYQQKENALLLNEYCKVYELPYCRPGIPSPCCGLPLIFLGKSHQEIISGDSPILNNVRETIKEVENKCPLIDGGLIDFKELNLVALPGFPKIWTENKILMKKGPGGNSDLLKNLLTTENLPQVLRRTEFRKIEPIKVALSGKYVEFENAIEIKGWIFQWNGREFEISGYPSKEEPLLEKETTSKNNLPFQEIGTSLTLAQISSLAAVDAINPCALAVLSLMLIAILAYNPEKKKNLLLAGSAFIISVFVMYLVYGLIIVKSFQLIQALTSVRVYLYKILGGVAIILGCFKLRDFFRAGGVCKVSPRVNKIISKVTSTKGAFLVGAFVAIFLLPCTIGPYIICGGILSGLCLSKSLPLLLLYNLIFVLPMVILVWIIYLGLSKVEDISKWQAKNIKYLDLASGLVILGLGIAMISGLV